MSSMRTAEVVDDSSATGSPPPPGSLCDDSETALSALALIDLHLETMEEKEVNEVSLEEGPGTGRKSRARISCKNAPFAYTDVRLKKKKTNLFANSLSSMWTPGNGRARSLSSSRGGSEGTKGRKGKARSVSGEVASKASVLPSPGLTGSFSTDMPFLRKLWSVPRVVVDVDDD